MQKVTNNTIAAISTPPGRGGIGVVRLSGPKALECSLPLFKKKKGKLTKKSIKSHKAYYGEVVDPKSGEAIDEAMFLFMRGPRSYTCEDMVEMSMHGSPVVLESVLALLLLRGSMLAAPGEFTKRAFLNKRLDLVQAEAVADLINSRSELESKFATRRVSGELSNYIEKMKQTIVAFLSELEAEIDFPEDVPEMDKARKLKLMSAIEQDILKLLESFNKSKMISNGIRIVIAGATNAGKSTLFNAILRRNRAITSELPGTTRDYLAEEFELGGLIMKIFDTAGINFATEDVIEMTGVTKTIEIIGDSDLILYLLDGSKSLSKIDKSNIERFQDKEKIIVINKIDKGNQINPKELGKMDFITVSALEGTNLERLENMIKNIFKTKIGDINESLAISNLRQELELKSAYDNFAKARESLVSNASPEFVSFDLKKGYEHLCFFKGDEELNLEDEVLDKIFSSFCIGK